MDIFWYVLTGLLLVGYLSLESIDFGVGMLVPALGAEPDRERLRGRIVPLFLANEVWLVAFVGLLFGAFPQAEGTLLHVLRPYVVVLVCAWMLRDAALWFRTARPGAGWRRLWDAVLPSAGVALAVGWGIVFAVLIRGLSTDGHGRAAAALGDLAHPLAPVCALLAVAASLRQGALFACRALPGHDAVREPAVQVARQSGRALIGLLLLLAVLVAATTDVPVAAVAGVAAAGVVYASGRALAVGRVDRALLYGAAGWLSLPVTVIAVHGTTLLATRSGTGSLTVSATAADSGSLTLLTVTVLPALVPVAIGQVWMWRVFGRRGARPTQVRPAQ
ncbi:cytochrome d ubiquinol oxidase subunit II [Streptomyces sp. NPDC051576]|uniref:cytochrome d ubiquinol oxidase subunit II n=1 Tax=Streptomyces sp. NPDC051576 TaxID=3155803 RepID=UPI003446AC39